MSTYRAADDLNLTPQQVADAAAAQAEADHHRAMHNAALNLAPCLHETVDSIRYLSGDGWDVCADCGIRLDNQGDA